MALTTQKDTTFTKIFVGGLPYHTTDQTLRSFFEPFGEIAEAVVITDRQTGKSRGYGFVTMVDEAAAQRACKDPNPIIDGRKANVNLAYLGAKPRLPVGDILAASSFPYALKTGIPAVYPVGEIIGFPPQWLYQSPGGTATFLSGGPGQPATLTALPQHSPHSPITAQTLAALGHPFFDYGTLAAAAAAGGYQTAGCPQLAGFEPFPGATCPTPTGFLTHNSAAAAAAAAAGFTPITYAGPATPAVSAAAVQFGHQLAAAAAHYRPLSIQDRM